MERVADGSPHQAMGMGTGVWLRAWANKAKRDNDLNTFATSRLEQISGYGPHVGKYTRHALSNTAFLEHRPHQYLNDYNQLQKTSCTYLAHLMSEFHKFLIR